MWGLGQAAATLCGVAYRLQRNSFPELLEALHLDERAAPADAGAVDRAIRWVAQAHRLVPLERNCLLDALAAAALLRQQGYSVPLFIGVRKQRESLQAHAWLGHARPEENEDFQILYRVPAES